MTPWSIQTLMYSFLSGLKVPILLATLTHAYLDLVDGKIRHLPITAVTL